jgi:general secretion pathway protein G
MILAAPQTALRRATRRAGFTLLEVLVVVAILVILAGVGVVATTSYLEKARKNQAQLQCKSLANACETYYLDPQSGGNYPENLQQLLQPFGGTAGAGSLLKNGERDLINPWGQPYSYQVGAKPDGTPWPEVFTVSPDGVRINQNGVGQMAQ